MTDQRLGLGNSSLYAGSARSTLLGRVATHRKLAERPGRWPSTSTVRGVARYRLRSWLADPADGSLVRRGVGIDADPACGRGRPAKPTAQASRMSPGGSCVCEQLPAGIPDPTVVTFAQSSIGWTAAVSRDWCGPCSPPVARGARRRDDSRGHGPDEQLPLPPTAPRPIRALIRPVLGDVRRAGQATLPSGRHNRAVRMTFIGGPGLADRASESACPRLYVAPRGGPGVDLLAVPARPRICSERGSKPSTFVCERCSTKTRRRRIQRTPPWHHCRQSGADL